MVSQGDAAVKRQLQKAFKLIEQAVQSSEGQMSEATKLLSSVCNLCEQFECCKAVKFETTPLKQFPDVKTKLLLKLSSEIEEKMEQLSSMLGQQEIFGQRISKQRQSVTDVYKKYSDHMEIDTLVQRTATEPSIADMMEWVIDTNNAFHQQLCCKKHLLEALRYDDSKTTESLQKAFIPDERAMISQIQEKLDRVMFFAKKDL